MFYSSLELVIDNAVILQSLVNFLSYHSCLSAVFLIYNELKYQIKIDLRLCLSNVDLS